MKCDTLLRHVSALKETRVDNVDCQSPAWMAHTGSSLHRAPCGGWIGTRRAAEMCQIQGTVRVHYLPKLGCLRV